MSNQQTTSVEQKLFESILKEKERRAQASGVDAPASKARLQMLSDWQKQTTSLLGDLVDNDTVLEAIERELVSLDRAYETGPTANATRSRQEASSRSDRAFEQVETAISMLALRVVREGIHPLKSKGDAYRHVSLILENEPKRDNLDSVWFVYRFVDQNEQARIIELLEQHGQRYEVVSYQQEVFGELVEQANVGIREEREGNRIKYCSSPFRQRLAMDAFRPAIDYFYDHGPLIEWAKQQPATSHQWIAVLDGDYFVTHHAWRRLSEDLIDVGEDVEQAFLPVSDVDDEASLLNDSALPRPDHQPQWLYRRDSFTTTHASPESTRIQRPQAGWVARLDLPAPINRGEQRFSDAFLPFARSVGGKQATDLKRFVFGIPLRPQALTQDWDTVCNNLQRTLYNLSRQTCAEFSVLVACHEIPDISTYDLDIKFLLADFEPPDPAVKDYGSDKGKKKRLINLELAQAEYHDVYYMPLDADDLLRVDLVENVLFDDNRRGYVIESGYVYDMSEDSIGLCNAGRFPFWSRCGSSAIFYLTTEDLPTSRGDNEAYLVTLKSHVEFKQLASERGRNLDSFAGRMGVYVLGHGENNRQHYKGMGQRVRNFTQAHETKDHETIMDFKYQFPEVMFFRKSPHVEGVDDAKVEKRAIVMPSIGDREWVEYSSRTFLPYAKKCKADFFVERSIPENFIFPDLPDSPGRSNKKIFALKAFLVWKYLGELGYDKLLIVDDSCCVMDNAPSIFESVPQGTCGMTTTTLEHANRSFADIEKFIADNGEEPIEYDDRKYMNSGVMVYDSTMLHAFNPEEILRCSSLLYSKYPHQTLTYYLLLRHSVPIKAVSKNFNRIPNSTDETRQTMVDPEPYIDNAFIHHFTGAYHRRDILIPRMAKLILARQSSELSQLEDGTTRAPPPAE